MLTNHPHAGPPPYAHGRELREAIRGLYRVFHGYSLDHDVTGCPHCTSDADNVMLHSKPLHELTARDLARFAFKAMTTLGTEDDFRHFLPRLFELAADGSLGEQIELPVLFGKLPYANWRRWPTNERAAVETFCAALWGETLSAYPREPSADELLCSLGNAFDDLIPFLGEWAAGASEPAAARHLATLAEANYDALMRGGRLWDAFWGGHEAQMTQVIRWLADPARAATVEAAFHANAAEPFAQELSTGVTYLEAIAATLRAR